MIEIMKNKIGEIKKMDYLNDINTEIMNKVMKECLENGKKDVIIPDEIKKKLSLSPHSELSNVEIS